MLEDKLIKEWICSKLNIKETFRLDSLYKNSFALNYLFVWTIFERKNFDSFMKVGKIEEFAKQKINYIDILEEYFYHFYERYKIGEEGNKKRKNLCHKSKCNGRCYTPCKFYQILKKEFGKISAEEKIYFLVYIVYRYRNNMFHGTKGLESWIRYKLEIERCIDIMMKLSD